MTIEKIRPITILHVLSGLDVGGIETVIMSIYKNINRNKIQFDFVLHTDEIQHYTPIVKEMGAKIYVAPQLKKVGIFKYVLWWNKFFKEHTQYSVVHGHVPTYASIYLGIAKKYKCTTICHCHTAFPVVKGITKIIRYILHYPLHWVANYYFACSVVAGEYLFGKNIVNKSCFQVIPNARDTKLFSYKPEIREQMRKQLGLTNCFVVGNVGRLTEVDPLFFIALFAALLPYAHPLSIIELLLVF